MLHSGTPPDSRQQVKTDAAMPSTLPAEKLAALNTDPQATKVFREVHGSTYNSFGIRIYERFDANYADSRGIGPELDDRFNGKSKLVFDASVNPSQMHAAKLPKGAGTPSPDNRYTSVEEAAFVGLKEAAAQTATDRTERAFIIYQRLDEIFGIGALRSIGGVADRFSGRAGGAADELLRDVPAGTKGVAYGHSHPPAPHHFSPQDVQFAQSNGLSSAFVIHAGEGAPMDQFDWNANPDDRRLTRWISNE
jgi:hypothetical protein